MAKPPPHHRNSPFPLQHVHYQPVYPPSSEQVPHHASKVPGGVEQLIFAVLVQVFVRDGMYLEMTQEQIQRCRCTNPLFILYGTIKYPIVP